MKKVTLVVALTALCGLAASTFADVQNIRLSGDIRLRGYYLNAVDGSAADEAFIAQRTRVTVEADLEDHVLAVVTLKGEGLWGAEPVGGVSAASASWAVGMPEAYVQLNEVFYTPATLKLGRQSLNYGHGMIFSSADGEYAFDAARLVLDYYPLTIDVVAGQLANATTFGPLTHGPASDLLFLNGRYEFKDSIIQNIEVYFGWVSQNDAAAAGGAAPGVSLNGVSPGIVGIRSDLVPTENLKAWGEFAYEFGGGAARPGGISAILLNLGASYTCKKSSLAPSFNASWTFAGGSAGKGQFVPLFDYTDANGILFAPALANIHIFNLGASIKPSANTSLGLQAFYYLKSDKAVSAANSGSNPLHDFGGIATAQGTARELGWEFDAILGYDYSKDVRAQFVYALFLPENDLQVTVPQAAHELRGELTVKF